MHSISSSTQPEKYSTNDVVAKPPVAKPSQPIVQKPTYTPPKPRIPAKPAFTPTKRTKVQAAPVRSEVMEDEGLYRFTVTKQASKGFSIQIGAYGEYGNVLREVEKLEKTFNEPILVHIAKLKGKPVYKIMVGSFNNRNEATSFKQQVINNGLQAMIKDLATIG